MQRENQTRKKTRFPNNKKAARLAADVCDVPTILVARTDALGAFLLTSDVDDYDKPFLTGERTSEGFYGIKVGVFICIVYITM